MSMFGLLRVPASTVSTRLFLVFEHGLGASLCLRKSLLLWVLAALPVTLGACRMVKTECKALLRDLKAKNAF